MAKKAPPKAPSNPKTGRPPKVPNHKGKMVC